MAVGYAGQYIFVVPEHDLVVAVTSDLSSDRFYIPVTVLEYIIQAVQSSAPLDPNPEGVELLESRIQEAAQGQTEP